MPVDDRYALRESWTGSYYELGIQISPSADDGALEAAIAALWSAPEFRGGPWYARDATDATVKPRVPELDSMTSYYGLLAGPDLGELQCVSWIIREPKLGSDWLDVSIPTAALTPFGFTYPAYESPATILHALDVTFISIAAHVYSKVSFSLALVGEEVSGMASAESLTSEQGHAGRLLLPRRLVTNLKLEKIAQRVASDLFWIPPPA